jgi:nicotinamidase/pyrazinamidase
MAINKNALILVDIQNDFCPGGSLAVPEGDKIVPIANALQPHFHLVIATQDWHPRDHMSFAANHQGQKPGDVVSLNGIPQVLWPVHCVQNSRGAAFHPDLDLTHVNKIIYKGMDRTVDSYSAFFDNQQLRATALADYLLEHGVSDIYIMGLATDYCVKYSCLDAAALSLKTHVIADACRGIELQSGDIDRALKEMREMGVEIVNSRDILATNIHFD